MQIEICSCAQKQPILLKWPRSLTTWWLLLCFCVHMCMCVYLCGQPIMSSWRGHLAVDSQSLPGFHRYRSLLIVSSIFVIMGSQTPGFGRLQQLT
uniref:Uncharacterized protein n=1 Tax=Haplochromis burtoni TaxID=8153 RepID=A0A3Q2W6N6_HAPBU